MPTPVCMTPYECLFDCIQRLATRASNPVLEVLHGVAQVEQEKRYPEHGLAFAHQGVRAFYHCHDTAAAPANEHGHFHIFLSPDDVQATASDWVHLAGLTMDHLGQPLRWFTVNRWVSGGPWRAAPQLVTLMAQISTTTGLLLVEEWLLAMLKVYHQELEQLLNARDQSLTQLMATANAQAVLEDRRYYDLSACAIDLLTKFQQQH